MSLQPSLLSGPLFLSLSNKALRLWGLWDWFWSSACLPLCPNVAWDKRLLVCEICLAVARPAGLEPVPVTSRRGYARHFPHYRYRNSPDETLPDLPVCLDN